MDVVAKNNNITIVIQGLLDKPRFEKSLDHYKEISGGNVILSTWECHRNLADPAWDIHTVFNQPPLYRFWNMGNLNCQAITILGGCFLSKTPFTIKVRTDEYRTDLSKFINIMLANPDKMTTDNPFFRPTNLRILHCGDHIIGMKTKAMRATFRNVMKVCRKYHTYNSMEGLPPELFGLERRYNMDGFFPETVITTSYLKYKKEPLDQDNNTAIMMKHFNVVDINEMGEFLVNCNNCAPQDSVLTTDRFREFNDGNVDFGSIKSFYEMDIPRTKPHFNDPSL